MAAGVLLYGIMLDELEESETGLDELESDSLTELTRAKANQKQLDIPIPPFGCVMFRSFHLFFAIQESILLASGNDVVRLERLDIDPGWDNRLERLCSLFDLGTRQPRWYLTDIDDDEHDENGILIT